MKFGDKTRIAIIAIALALTLGIITGIVYSVRGGMFAAFATLTMVLSYKYPRLALWSFLIYLPFGGTLTYYLGAHPLLHLVKDLFYFPALVGLVRQPSFRRQIRQDIRPHLKRLKIPLLLVLVVSFGTLLLVNGWQEIQSSGGDNPLLIGLVGVKVLFGYIPLVICAPYLVRDRKDLEFFLRLHILIIIICCSLCLLQYGLLAAQFCPGSEGLTGLANDRASLDARCFVGGALLYNPSRDLIRLPGTFVSPWQWAWFLISASFLAYIGYMSDSDKRWRMGGLVAIAYIFTAVVLSGQRLAMALVPLIIFTLAFLTKRRKFWLFVEMGVGGFVSLLLLANLIDLRDPIRSFIDRWSASPPHDFVVDQMIWSVEKQGDIWGAGLGRATNAARFLGNTSLVETYYAKLIYEVGVLGFLAFFVFLSALVWVTFKAYRSLHHPTLKNVGLCLWIYLVLISYNTFYYPLDVDPVAVYYWFLAGVLLQLPQMPQEKRARQQLSPPSEAISPPLPVLEEHPESVINRS
ncbi:hypothetical protein [Spirulina subsalsa]|uniref:hypothetical protein n=1 Tax=Spirulina subsalsa TaxID=54311 RepID=UPI0002F2794D|nr:hypothetical protein [Spirulina subsalsa]